MDSRRVIKILEQNGWCIKRISGSHHIFYKEDVKEYVNVPPPRKEIPVGTLRDIESKSGLKFR